MKGSIERVTAVINGGIPDRAPLFDLLRNDAVIEHFAGTPLTVENAPRVVNEAFVHAVDATRSMRLPGSEGTVILENGRERRNSRWTSWTAHKQYGDSENYAAAKQAELESSDPCAWNEENQRSLEEGLRRHREETVQRGDFFFMPGAGSPGLTGIYEEVGLESFSYYLADCPGVITELLEHNTARIVTRYEHYPEDHGQIVGFTCDDLAFNSGPLISPVWLREHYFPGLKRITDAMHKKGIKLFFHSDGNLNPVLDDLVEAGIDGLNPIEILAGMDVGNIHKRHPDLFMSGGIDVSQLLPFGKPADVADVVKKTLDDAEGRIMIGSTTELHNDVPLENFLALRNAVLEYRY
ncbi:MAG: hypothetical protein HN341_06040 [Verrucomicrobia bacterium]|jgi:hypothetical protein|nr:hypothetical protein [Verrucomicrobiota bacterium]